jgi:tRNA U34 5-carboxymethylaminomethyl modifying GTPase MnmE/TrmE
MRPEIIDYFQGLQSIINETIDILSTRHPSSAPSWIQRLLKQQEKLHNTDSLRIALIGEFNAGKSSIISALTGEEVFIDADVATNAIHEYPWRGAILVDTPGVHRDDAETNHDRIAREATVGADLILFVITNELLDPRLAKHLHFVIDSDGLALSKKTAILVNKMDRENNSDEIIVSEVVKALGDRIDIPIWFCAAGKYIQAESVREELRKRFINESRIPLLIENINIFIREAGILGRLTTPLQEVIDILDQAQSGLIKDNDAEKELELIRRQKKIINDLNKELLEIRGTWKKKVFSVVMNQAEPKVQQIVDTMTDEDFQALFENGLAEADGEISSIYDGLSAEIIGAYNKAKIDLDELGKSKLSEDVNSIQRKKEKQVCLEKGLEPPKAKTLLAKGSKSLLDVIKQNPQKVKDVVYKVGKALKIKFRPWGATKIAGKLSKALPFLSFALDSYLNYREEKVKEEREKHLANSRIALRNAFAGQAKNISNYIEHAIDNEYLSQVNQTIQKLDDEANDVTCRYGARRELADTINQLKLRCGELRNDLYRSSNITESEL